MKNLSPRAPDRERITLLAVTPHTEDLNSLNRILDSEACEIREAASCREATQLIQEHPPTVIACDRELPDGTWKDLFSLLHAVEVPPPLIVMSHHADERLWAEVLNVGGYDVLAKPFERTEVSRVLEMACRYGRALQSAL